MNKIEMDRLAKIYVAGHRGLVGSAVLRELQRLGYKNLLLRTRAELDLLNGPAVERFYLEHRPDYVIDAAARVGGIIANSTRPAEFIHENLSIQNHLIHGAYRSGVKKLLFLGSSCIYPRTAPQPLKEEYLLTSALEPTNEWYAIAKIAGIKLCQAYRRQYGCKFISVMPTNLYGPGDSYDPQQSHVIPGLIRKFHDAKVAGAEQVTCWGTGKALREFMYVDDLARACIFLMSHYDQEELINIGSGIELSILDLSERIAKVTGYGGRIEWDAGKPDGTPRKMLDSTRIRNLGWAPEVTLEAGLAKSYEDFLARFARKSA